MKDEELHVFAKRYEQMQEPELMKIAREYDQLIEPAQAALREEFRRRKLEPPLIETEESEPVPQSLVTIGRYRDLAEAIVVRNLLESEGIACFLQDENLVRMDWFYSNLIGGMRLQVASEDEASARELLAQPTPSSFAVPGEPDFQQPVCPQCGSSEVSLDDSDRKVLAVSMLIGVPLPHRKPQGEVWRCDHCGCKWVDDGEPDQPVSA